MKRRDLRLRRRSRVRAEELAAFTYSAQDGLLRTAYLLTGDEWTARHLVESALVRLHLGWRHLERDRAEHEARRLLLREYGGHRPRRGAGAADSGAGCGAGCGAEDGGVWGTLRRLPVMQRAVAVLLFHDGLTEEDVADLLGVGVEVVRSEAGHVLAAIRAPGGEHAA